MQAYVCGFAFDDTGNVALIRKQRPEWQKGRLNGIGGHVEDRESGAEAMRREFWEETGVRVHDWELFVTLEGREWFCEFYRAFDVDLSKAKTTTDEQVEVYSTLEKLPKDVITNLNWLIPLALDSEPIIPNSIWYE